MPIVHILNKKENIFNKCHYVEMFKFNNIGILRFSKREIYRFLKTERIKSICNKDRTFFENMKHGEIESIIYNEIIDLIVDNIIKNKEKYINSIFKNLKKEKHYIKNRSLSYNDCFKKTERFNVLMFEILDSKDNIIDLMFKDVAIKHYLPLFEEIILSTKNS